jgi:hypothetical protein
VVAAALSSSTQDARGVLTDAGRALGVDALTSVRYSGRGFTYSFAQNYQPDVP